MITYKIKSKIWKVSYSFNGEHYYAFKILVKNNITFEPVLIEWIMIIELDKLSIFGHYTSEESKDLFTYLKDESEKIDIDEFIKDFNNKNSKYQLIR